MRIEIPDPDSAFRLCLCSSCGGMPWYERDGGLYLVACACGIRSSPAISRHDCQNQWNKQHGIGYREPKRRKCKGYAEH